jgi:hypothetical protein
MTHNAKTEAPAQEPKVVKLEVGDLQQMLAALLASQAETAQVHRQLLAIEVKKQQAQERKDEDARVRLEKERKQLHEQMNIRLHNVELQIKSCSHKDQRGGSTIYPISNHPDRRLRGVCTHCPIYIEPEHYVMNAAGDTTLVPEHELYKQVLQRDRDLYSEFVPTTSY